MTCLCAMLRCIGCKRLDRWQGREKDVEGHCADFFPATWSKCIHELVSPIIFTIFNVRRAARITIVKRLRKAVSWIGMSCLNVVRRRFRCITHPQTLICPPAAPHLKSDTEPCSISVSTARHQDMGSRSKCRRDAVVESTNGSAIALLRCQGPTTSLRSIIPTFPESTTLVFPARYRIRHDGRG